MTQPFFTLPVADAFWLRHVTLAAGTLDPVLAASLGPAREAYLYDVDLKIEQGRIAAVAPAGSAPADGGPDLRHRLVWPGFVDIHTHLDKGHVIRRTPNPDGTFFGALQATAADRTAYWSYDDVTRRMDFGLRCAYAHGVTAIRTHLDSFGPQAEISWAAFRALRDRWQGRIALQAVSLVTIECYLGADGDRLAELVARSGGVIGAVTRLSGVDHGSLDEIDLLLDRLFTLAAGHRLDIDLHVDETGDPEAFTLPRIAAAIERHDFTGTVAADHCCSLAVQPPEVAAAAIAACAKVGLTVVTLPNANMYLQDRIAGRTPRWRGVTLAHELKAAGVPVAIATDNCRDAFAAYGDHDTLDSFRYALRVSQLDHPFGDWAGGIAGVPAATMGLDDAGLVAVGRTADLVLTRARSFDELVSRPQADRLVLRAGRPIDSSLPDHAELDDLITAPARPG